jgi:hypothetical protein
MKTKLFTLLIAITFISFSQTEKLNQLDDKGKKHGKWVVYLGNTWEKVKDSSEAVYFRYNVFDHGASLYPMGPMGKGWRLETLEGASQKGLLDGTYK